ncbi:MAG: hypothetical protein NWQ54_22535 [Paraglaciecola sp.]|uniref:hypothetical protein n=1 Tax=Pseudomonadati TaxID=3379134 RepID=UPI00273D4887|nr:hypothetical protein [Paraglaciecola sp.]MDP5032960.1 hypothetical protein [Paraglaciecola sp.]MDP5040949.1 hypothetical protein [Paraglaciecola sp.]MDP5133671.1 hypothetical protein [Paraglaciecola sp.]
MQTVHSFIKNKSKQLAYFVNAYLDYKIVYEELDLFFWDTMEEWAQIQQGKHLPYGQNENVFWHLMHQIHYWPQETLLTDLFLRDELMTCVDALLGQKKYPFPMDCIGIRP